MSDKIIKKCNSWDDFTNALTRLNNKECGNAFELLTELLLQIDPVYRTSLKHVWHHTTIPKHLITKLGLARKEIGVDLVAESKDGKYWAIQCKYHHDPSKNVTLNELQSFSDMTQNVCKGKFHTCLVVTSANNYAKNLQKYHPEFQYCLGDRFLSLETSFFKDARRVLKKKTPKITPLKPYPHQKTAIKNALAHFSKEKRGKLIHPCGTGKSLIGYWIAETLAKKTTLVAVPSLYLVRQTLADWTKESLAKNIKIDWIVVCSEKTIGETQKDDPAMRFQELGVDVTTKVGEITAFLKKRTSARKVVFTTYQSGVVTAKAARKAKRTFDVGIFDEAHKTVGTKDSLFAHLLDDKKIAIRKRIFMTATERRYRGDSERILTMEDPNIYGETFDLITYKEALAKKPPILCDYKIVTMVISREEIKGLFNQNLLVKPDSGKWDKETEAKTLAALVALRKAMHKYRAHHSLTFHNSIAGAKAFRESHERFNNSTKNLGDVSSFHVSSKVSTGERKIELDDFAYSKNAIVTNARCLTEGVDIPKIDAVLFVDSKRSAVDIVQAAGRALRTSPGKRKGYIIVPVLVDDKKTHKADETYEDILMVLRAMASNDDRIVEYFRAISLGRRPSKRGTPIDVDVPDALKINLEDFVKNIETRSWSKLAKLSWMPFEEAREFVRRLNFSGESEWRKYCRGELKNKPKKPNDIPTSAYKVYKDRGWLSYGDWFGTEHSRIHKNFKEARAFVHTLKLQSSGEWEKYCRGELKNKPKKPNDIPSNPKSKYKDQGYVNWGDWLGTGRTRNYLPFKKARAFVHTLKLKNNKEWRKYCRGEFKSKRPNNLPTNPAIFYKDKDWKGYGDWLGTGRGADRYKDFLPYKEAREFVHTLKLKSAKEWASYCKGKLKGKPKKPDNIPVTASRTYKDKGWKGYGDWLGISFLSYKEARAFVHTLKLKGIKEWESYCRGELKNKPKKPNNIPRSPKTVYKDKGWKNIEDWTDYKAYNFLSYKEARAFVHTLKLKGDNDWQKYKRGKLKGKPKKPDNIPANPHLTYKDKGWKSTEDWTGYKTHNFLSFKKARAFTHKLKLNSYKEWESYCKGKLKGKPKKPDNIPKTPATVYKDKGWKNYTDWLGKK